MKVKRFLIAFTVAIISVIAALGIAFFILTNPSVKISGWQELDLAKLERIHHTATIVDADGSIIADGIYSKNRIYTPISEIPQWTKDAFISIEDKRFYSHNGIDYIRMFGAFKNNLRSASLKEGASTITQQLIKNTHLSNEKTFTRKFQEIRIAKQLEKKYSKEEILESYLNILYFGNNIYGIGQAARSYFDKDVSELNVAESALLAGIINNPSRYNPLTSADKALRRRNVVISRMLANKKIDAQTADAAEKSEIEVKTPQYNPYLSYIENVVAEAAERLDCLQEELFEKKPTIITDTNIALFEKINSSMSDILYKTPYKVRALIVDNSDSSVICDVSNISGTSSILRQPGSVIKPFVSFAPALEKKLVYPVSIVHDEKTDFNGYAPGNFGDKYYGNITVADSLKYSLNVPAVKLTDMCGIPYAKKVAMKFGLNFSEKDNGLAIALGGLNEGLSLNQIADAYSTLAKYGVYEKSSYIKAVIVDGKKVYEKSATKRRAVGEDTAFLLTDMLINCAKSGTAKKLHVFDNVAAKTGTVERGDTNSDAYCVAYTPKYTVAVWYGNDSDEKSIYGGGEPTVLAKKILEVLGDCGRFYMPESVEKLSVDVKKLYDEGNVYLASPTLPKRYCGDAYFSRRNVPKRYSYSEMPFAFDDGLGDLDNFEIIDGVL